MVVIACTIPTCDFKTDDVSEALAIVLLANHGLSHQYTLPHTTGPLLPPVPRGPKLERPKVIIGVSTEEWNLFTRRWEVFRTGSGIDDESAPSQLFQCAENELGDSLLKANPHAASATLPDLLDAMRSLAVIPVATGVLRTELLQLRQERDEPFRAFTAPVRGKAETCAFTTICECGKNVDYTDHVIRDVLLNGISDPDIRREVLGTTNILQTPVNDVIALVENKEMARNALPSSTLLAVSSFKRQQVPPKEPPSATPSRADQTKQAACPDCQRLFRIFTEGTRGWNTKPHTVCLNCYRVRRRRKRTPHMPPPPPPTSQAVESDPISQVASFHSGSARRRRRRKHAKARQGSVGRFAPVPSTITSLLRASGNGRASETTPESQSLSPLTPQPGPDIERPTAPRTLSQRSQQSPTPMHNPTCDFIACGFSRDDLLPVRLGLSAANRSPISIEGAFFAKLTTQPHNGEVTSCRSMVYVSSSVHAMYLSYDALLNLGVLSKDFPSLKTTPIPKEGCHTRDSDPADANRKPPPVNAVRSINDGCTTTSDPNNITCSCPQRDATPPRPSELPFPCTPDNNGRMKGWLLDRYASSTFNTCPHRALPSMEGPPIEIHVEPTATPKACHTPAPVPLHWQRRVYEELLRDEALGVIERVPYGEPVTWCHRMVITRKHDGSPRRTVDLSPLNKFCRRETFATETPFHLARRIPKDTWKTVTDAWNGYHSVPLRQSDRHLTTFVTPFGLWRYTRAPQGFLSSGDGYNRRFDAVLSTFERKERCVDDTIHYDSDLEQHWWRTIDFLTRVGQAGIRTLPWRFDIKHLPGKTNHAADATSRQPSPSGSVHGTSLGVSSIPDLMESALMASIRQDTQDVGTISWSLLGRETASDTALSSLGNPSLARNDHSLAPLWPICESVYAQEGVLLYQDRVIVPSSLRSRILQHLHAAHQGTSMMAQRARAIVYWSGMSTDIRNMRDGCADCNRNAPTQAATPPLPATPPSTPFLSHVRRLLHLWRPPLPRGTTLAGAAGLIRHLRSFFATFGVPEELSSDGGPEFSAGCTEAFFRLWGVRHRVSSAHFPQSNGRAEVAVKSAKRLLMSNTCPTGSLDHDRFLCAMLQLRNTPDPDCNISPAQIVFGRPLRDTLSFVNRLEKFSNPNEGALRSRISRTTESLKEHSQPLRPLALGERVFIQNQQGTSPNKWDRSGIVVESSGHDQYRVKVDGSGRLTSRNRRFLRACTPANPSIALIPTVPHSSPSTVHASAPPPPPPHRLVEVGPHPSTPPPPCQENLPPPSQAPAPSDVSSDAPTAPSSGTAPTLEPPVTQAPVPEPLSIPPVSPRPCRERRPPKRFEPETGLWVPR
ncbi:Uncharacterized protein P5673_012717 [Acropora cervicornis]|uniref:Integrase catalytic domain-containing protein n=1 Tax=Acropora cervicornis TaxID=6130 RepID=A0AAD9V731_ACRCE|nr:Uncharacterized protein P5673_012717 [Acropora cervicornis]